MYASSRYLRPVLVYTRAPLQFLKPTTQVGVASLKTPVKSKVLSMIYTENANYKLCEFPVCTWMLLHTISIHNGYVTHFTSLPYLRMHKCNFLRKSWKRIWRYNFLLMIKNLGIFKHLGHPLIFWDHNLHPNISLMTF